MTLLLLLRNSGFVPPPPTLEACFLGYGGGPYAVTTYGGASLCVEGSTPTVIESNVEEFCIIDSSCEI